MVQKGDSAELGGHYTHPNENNTISLHDCTIMVRFSLTSTVMVR